MKAAWLLLPCATLSACPLLVDDELEMIEVPAGASGTRAGAPVAGGAPSEGGGGGGGGGELLTSDAGSTSICEGSPSPSLDGDCPAGCDRCEASVCIVDCSALDACKGRDVSCPAGVSCRIECGAKASCQGASLACPAEHDCELRCTGDDSCQGASLVCGEGRCLVTCGEAPKACDKLNVTCGGAPCEAVCPEAGPLPKLDCRGSCDCRPC